MMLEIQALAWKKYKNMAEVPKSDFVDYKKGVLDS
jgi:hypothetical protein